MTCRACHVAGRFCLLIIVIFPPVTVIAGFSNDVFANPIVITVRSLKGLDFDGWDSEISADNVLIGRGKASLDERLKVRFHRVSGYQPQWKVDHSLRFHFDRPFSSSNGLVFALSRQEYRDQSTRRYQIGRNAITPLSPYDPTIISMENHFINSDDDIIRSTNFGVGGRLKTENGIELEGLLGPVFDHRAGVSQEGIKYGFKFDFDTDSIAWKGDGWFSHFGSGDDHNVNLEAEGKYGLSDAALDWFTVRYMTGSRREFLGISGDIGRRDDSRVELNNDLTVIISEMMKFDWNSNLTNKMAQSRNQISGRRDREFNWQNNLEGVWSASGKFVLFTSGIDIQQQEYAGGLTQGRNSRLQIMTGFETPSMDSSIVEVGVSRYRFDTPDELDYNDRDELSWHVGIRSGTQITSTVGIRGGVEANLNHLVYIHRSRSGENRWTRQFTLFSEVPWQDYPITNRARFAVSAHYTDYDFLPFDLTRSRLFRTFTAVDTFRFDASRGWGGEIAGSGQLNDHGQLDWSEWIENVSERGYSYTVTILPYRKINNSEIALGWLMHRRSSTLLQDGDSPKNGEDVRSRGPVARVYMKPSKSVRLEFLATFLTISQLGKHSENQPEMNFTFTWTL